MTVAKCQRIHALAKSLGSLTVTPAALRRSFEFDARVPAGVEGIAVAVDRVEKMSEIATKTTIINNFIMTNQFTNPYKMRSRACNFNLDHSHSHACER